jgi:mannose-6-phosphate isomerase-like protein (cupin superfamily)
MPFLEPQDMIHGEPLPGWVGRFFHAEQMTFAHYEIAAGSPSLHVHHHAEEEVWNIVDGEIELAVGEESRTLRAGDVAVIPPNTPHSATVTGRCRVVVADHPRRDSLPGGIGRGQ